MKSRLSLAVFTLLLPLAAQAQAEQPADAGLPDVVSYHNDIRPIFQLNCQGCHQPAKKSGSYLMTEHAALFEKGDSEEPGIVPGEPEKSYLLTMISGEEPAMPLERDPLTSRQVNLIRKWIEQGAKDDTPAQLGPRIDMEHPPVYDLPPVLTSVAYSSDGSLLAVSGYHETLLHKADGSGVVARLVGLAERVESAVFSPDGKRLAVTGGSPGRFGEVQIWDVEARELKLSLSVTGDTIYGAAWSPDGKLLSFGCGDNTVRAIDAETGKQVVFNGTHSDWVLDTVFSQDGSHLVSVSRDRSMKLTEVKTERFIDNITSITPGALKGGLMAVDRHPSEDNLLIGGADGVPKIYQMHRTSKRVIGDDANFIRKFPALPGRIYDVKFSADGQYVAACSSHDLQGEARVFETATAKEVSKLAGQEGGVFSIAFSPDGQTIASGGFDGAVRLNKVQTGELLKKFAAVPLKQVADAGGE